MALATHGRRERAARDEHGFHHAYGDEERFTAASIRSLAISVVNISSMGGKIHSPLGGWYHGTKFAVEALSDCLRLEVKPFGIDVVVIEPGGIKTGWGEIAAEGLLAASGSGAYAGQAQAMAATLGADANRSRTSPPTVIANAIAKAVTARRPKTRYAVGFGAKPLIGLRRPLPDRAFDTVIARATGLPH